MKWRPLQTLEENTTVFSKINTVKFSLEFWKVVRCFFLLHIYSKLCFGVRIITLGRSDGNYHLMNSPNAELYNFWNEFDLNRLSWKGKMTRRWRKICKNITAQDSGRKTTLETFSKYYRKRVLFLWCFGLHMLNLYWTAIKYTSVKCVLFLEKIEWLYVNNLKTLREWFVYLQEENKNSTCFKKSNRKRTQFSLRISMRRCMNGARSTSSNLNSFLTIALPLIL